MPDVGEKAPDFALANQDGQTIRLSDFRGQRILLFAYPKAATPGCTKQACGLRDAHPQLQAANALVFGISPDPPAVLKKWREEESLPYDLLSDMNHQVLVAWGAWGEREMDGRKSMGVIRSHWLIDEDGVIEMAELDIQPAQSVERAHQLLLA